MVTVVQGKVCAKNHPDRLSRLATIHQRYRRTDRQTDGRISYGISLDLTVGQKSSDFDKIWYTTADNEPDDSHVTKKLKLLKFKMAAAAILKIVFLAIIHRRIVRFQRNIVRGSRTACRYGLHDKNCKFLKSKMVDGRHLKIVKSPYLSEKFSDFIETWYTASDIEADDRHVTKN